MLLYRVLTSRLRVQGRKYGLAQRGGFILRFKLYSLIKGYWALWVWQVNKLYRHLEGFFHPVGCRQLVAIQPCGPPA